MREYVYKVAGLAIILMIIPGCFQQKINSSKAALSKKRAAFSRNELATNIDVAAASGSSSLHPEIEAKLIDIPSMIGSVIIEENSENILPDDQLALAWASVYEAHAIQTFYMHEMEQLGWQRMSSISALETTLIYQKPKKICVISIRPLSVKYKNGYNSLIYIIQSSKDK